MKKSNNAPWAVECPHCTEKNLIGAPITTEPLEQDETGEIECQCLNCKENFFIYIQIQVLKPEVDYFLPKS